MTNCILCIAPKYIIWKDSIPKFQINLCFDCVKLTMPYELDNTKTCEQCNNIFIFKFDWQKICISCWLKNKNGK